MSIPSHEGSLDYILFKDNCTRYRFVYCIPCKSDALTYFQKVCKAILRYTGRKVLTLQIDNAREYCSQQFMTTSVPKVSSTNLMVPYTLEQNAVSERDNRTIMQYIAQYTMLD